MQKKKNIRTLFTNSTYHGMPTSVPTIVANTSKTEVRKRYDSEFHLLFFFFLRRDRKVATFTPKSKFPKVSTL